MPEFKRKTFHFTTGKEIRLHGNGFGINKSLEIGETFVPNIYSLFDEQDEGKTATTVSNLHKLTAQELHELADYNIRLWLDLKDNLRRYGATSSKVFNREKLRSAENGESDSSNKNRGGKPNQSKEE